MRRVASYTFGLIFIVLACFLSIVVLHGPSAAEQRVYQANLERRKQLFMEESHWYGNQAHDILIRGGAYGPSPEEVMQKQQINTEMRAVETAIRDYEAKWSVGK